MFTVVNKCPVWRDKSKLSALIHCIMQFYCSYMDLVHINLYGVLVSIYGADSSFIFINKIVSHIKLTAKELHSI